MGVLDYYSLHVTSIVWSCQKGLICIRLLQSTCNKYSVVMSKGADMYQTITVYM